jgi:hypothetical protein
MRKLGLGLIVCLLAAPSLSSGAELKGKSLDSSTYKAELELKDGNPIQGKVRFRRGKRAVFTAHDGTDVDLRIRAICAVGLADRVDTCWPNLAVELDDLSGRGGNLKIKN